MNTPETALWCLLSFALSWFLTEHGPALLRKAGEIFHLLTTLPDYEQDDDENWE